MWQAHLQPHWVRVDQGVSGIKHLRVPNHQIHPAPQLHAGCCEDHQVSRILWRRVRDAATPKDITADVLLIKEFLRTHIGTTYARATQPSDANLLGVDMSTWGGLRRQRVCAPFNQLRGAQGGYRDYVRLQIAKLCPWHHWV